MMDQMKSLGFNTIHSPLLKRYLKYVTKCGWIAKIQTFKGLSGLQIMDHVVDYANKIGMRIMLSTAIALINFGQSPLWYTSTVPDLNMD